MKEVDRKGRQKTQKVDRKGGQKSPKSGQDTSKGGLEILNDTQNDSQSYTQNDNPKKHSYRWYTID